MKNFLFFLLILLAPFLAVLFFTAQPSYCASELEAAVAYWGQSPSGYVANPDDALDLRRDLDYHTEGKIQARLKVHMPLFLPNGYFMATFSKFTGQNTLSYPFRFDGAVFMNGIPFTSVTKLNHYDLAAYYSLIPFPLRDRFNVEAGVNARVLDLVVQIDQGALQAMKTSTVVEPLLYIGAQFKPVGPVSLEAEFRGMVFPKEHYLDVIGRAKFFPVRPFFVSAGYRYDEMRVNRNDINAYFKLSGPFIETGAEF